MEKILYKYYKQLKSLTRKLQFISITILILIIIYIIVFITIIYQLPITNGFDRDLVSPLIIFGVAISVLGIIFLFIYSKGKENATIIYEELTIGNEEFQNSDFKPLHHSKIKYEFDEKNSESNLENRQYLRERDFFSSKQSVQTEIKVAIKQFLKTTDLPFTKGKIGEIFYLILFIIFIVIMGYMKVNHI